MPMHLGLVVKKALNIMFPPDGTEGAEDDVLRNRRDEGKIVLPCRPKFPRRDKSFFQGHFGAASISVQAILWTPM
jgi:hypothetical protein